MPPAVSFAWGEYVGPQLNTLAAIVFLGVIAIAAMLTGNGENVTIPCITGIAGIAGNLQRPTGVSRAGDRPPSEPT